MIDQSERKSPARSNRSNRVERISTGKTLVQAIILIIALPRLSTLPAIAQTEPNKPPAQAAPQAESAQVKNVWKTYSLRPGLSIDLPSEPQPIQPPEDLVQQTTEFEGFLYSGPQGVVIVTYFALMEIHKESLHDYAAGVVKGILRTPGVADSKYALEATAESRIHLTGHYRINSKDLSFDGFAESRGKGIWSVLTLWRDADETARAGARRALNSARFTE